MTRRLLVLSFCWCLQDVAWSYMATGSALMRQQLLSRLLKLPGGTDLLHPPLRRCPRYHKGQCYAAGVLSALVQGNMYLTVPAAYESLLVESEVWDLWPWQIKVLQDFADNQQQQQQQQCTLSNSNSSSIDGLEPGSPTSSPPTTATSATTSSSSNSSIGLGHTCWPLLPYAAPMHGGSTSSNGGGDHSTANTCPAAEASCQLPPVSAEQLHLALERVCLNVQLCTVSADTSLQLLVLLLLRADPALRLAFLQGPQGGLLLAALQLYGCGSGLLRLVVETMCPGLGGGDGWLCSKGVGLQGLQEVLARATSHSCLEAAPTTELVLSWLLLQPSGTGAGSNHQCPSPSTSTSSSSTPSGTNSSSSFSSSGTSSWAQLQPDFAPGPVVRFGAPSLGELR
jgi:hypothetical protein